MDITMDAHAASSRRRDHRAGQQLPPVGGRDHELAAFLAGRHHDPDTSGRQCANRCPREDGKRTERPPAVTVQRLVFLWGPGSRYR